MSHTCDPAAAIADADVREHIQFLRDQDMPDDIIGRVTALAVAAYPPPPGFPMVDRCYCGDQPDDRVAQPHKRYGPRCNVMHVAPYRPVEADGPDGDGRG